MASSVGEGFQTDVVVIGGGASGLPAALSAVEAGAKNVTLLDRRKMLGGCARLAMGIFGVESPTQKRLGIQLTADDCFRQHMELANWMCDARLARNWLTSSKEIIRWLEEKGVDFDNVLALSGADRFFHQVAKQPSMTGNTIVNVLSQHLEEKNVQILKGTRAEKLITDNNGNVIGVQAKQNGKDVEIKAKSVIISTGSISGNMELLKRYFPEIDFSKVKIMTALPYVTGDGLLMAQEVGATKDAMMSYLSIGPHNHPHNVYTGLLMRRPHMVYVNKFGMRYADEGLMSLHRRGWGWLSGVALDRQPGRMAYVLTDHKILQDMIKNKEVFSGLEATQARVGSGDMLARASEATGVEVAHDNSMDWLDELEDGINNEVKKGRAQIADSWDEIAKWIGADPAVLKDTIDRYNTFCGNGYDAEFLKDKRYLLPLRTPPYYAFQGRSGADTFIGGIRINHRMEVLNKELEPIGGLYATGVATSGWLGPTYTFSGSEMGFSLYSGYTAGRIAAERSK